MGSETRATLLAQLREGSNPLAWEEFFQRYGPLIYAYARRKGCSGNTAEDVVQDVMLKIFEKRDVFRYEPERGRFRDWLGTVVWHTVVECRRRPSARVRPRGGDDQAELTLEGEEPEPAGIWEAAFEQAVLAAVLDVIRRESDPRDFLAFELSTLEEIAPGDVAAVTGLSRNAVYKARRRIMKRLRNLAAEYDVDGRLPERVREALRMRPLPTTERTLSRRMRDTLRGG